MRSKVGKTLKTKMLRTKAYRAFLKEKAKEFSELKIRVFSDETFENKKNHRKILGSMPQNKEYIAKYNEIFKKRNKNDSIFMRPCYESPLLSLEQQTHLFKKMNLHKYLACKAIKSLDLSKPNKRHLNYIENHLHKASIIRSQIASANFRMVAYTVKNAFRQSISGYNHADSLHSDGYFHVISAVDYFDWRKKLSFSTYLNYVVRNNLWRSSNYAFNHSKRFTTIPEDFEKEVNAAPPDNSKTIKAALKVIKKSKILSERDRQIISKRFGLDENKPMSLEDVGKIFNLSKERIRQLLDKALPVIKNKLQEKGLFFE